MSIKSRQKHFKAGLPVIKVESIWLGYSAHFQTFSPYRASDIGMHYRWMPKVGGPQISSANCKSATLRAYIICKICGPSSNVSLCGFAIFEPNLFCHLQICNLWIRRNMYLFLILSGMYSESVDRIFMTLYCTYNVQLYILYTAQCR